MFKSNIRLFLGSCVGALACALACGGCKKEADASLAPPKRPPAQVNVEAAIARDVPVYLDEIGKTVARESVTVTPQVSGRLDHLHFVDGADIKKGQLLFTIDARPFDAALQQAEGQLAKDLATYTNADKFFKRQADIFKQGFVSPSDYDTALFNAQAAKAAVDADKALADAARLNIEYCKIVSPIDGRAGMRLVDPGNVVKINETALLVIQRLTPIYADFTVNERDLNDVRRHMADHTLKTYARLPDESGVGREGDLTFLDNVVQDASGTIHLRAIIPNEDRHFWPGQFVKVRLVLQTMKNAVLISQSATQIGQKGSFVYVINDKSIAELHPVVLGQPQDGPNHEPMVSVISGVAEGDRVVTNGQLLVFPGGPVRIEDVAAPGGAAPASQPAATVPTTLPSSASQPSTRPAEVP